MTSKTKKIFQLSSTEMLSGIESRLLDRLRESVDTHCEILLSTSPNKDPLVDSWRAMAIGTVCRTHLSSSVRLWGLQSKTNIDIRELATYIPGLTSLYLCKKIETDGTNPEQIHPEAAVRWIANKEDGYPVPEVIVAGENGVEERDLRNNERLLVEFADYRARKLRKIAGSSGVISNSVFKSVIFEMTESLGISMFSNDEDRRSRLSGNAISGLAEFMKELFENAYKHGRFPDSLGGNTPRQLRYLQMRRLQQGGSAELSLADRGHRASPILGEYISQIMSTFASPHGKPFIEVNISDFGLGVLDHYLSKTSGEMRGDDRLSLLIKLLTQDLTSNRLDPNAGLGIQKAMKAARKARAFISVRTAEFWLGQSFTTGEEALGLQPLTDETLPRVVGTHWHFIWGPQR